MARDGHGDDARTLSYEVCVAGFKNMHDSCEHGGEMESGGFWFKLGPNTRSCDSREHNSSMTAREGSVTVRRWWIRV
jgi:hypothetical protein